MEDKQPVTGDLTEEVAEAEEAEASETTATNVDGAPEAGDVDQAVQADDVAQADDDAEEPATPEADEAADGVAEPGSNRGSRLARNTAVLAIGVSAALLIGSSAFAGAALQPYLADRATVQIKLDIARTAANAITTLWTYTPDDMDRLPDRSAKYLSGAFEDQYRKYVDAIQPTNKQAKVTNSTQVVGAAVESLRGPEATAIVFTNTTSTTPLSKNIPSVKYLSYRLELKQERGHWLVTKMTTITSLDLTPKL